MTQPILIRINLNISRGPLQSHTVGGWDVNAEPGGQMRVQLDRISPLYKAIYRQRTSCEKINSQAKKRGIERPKVRNRCSVHILNTLIYLIINTRALQRAQSINKGINAHPLPGGVQVMPK